MGSVWYWHFTESQGRGDLRPYIVVQFLPMLLIPAILLLFPARFSHSGSVHDKKIIEYTTTDYYELGLEGLAAVLKSLSTVVFWMT